MVVLIFFSYFHPRIWKIDQENEDEDVLRNYPIGGVPNY